MPDNPIARRSITILTVLTLFVVVTTLSPLLLAAAGLVDLSLRQRAGRSGLALRGLAFLWVYLLGELWALVALLVTAFLPRRAKIAATLRLQCSWARWNLTALLRLFSIDLDVEGAECVSPGPALVLSRHASIIDTLIPARIVAGLGGLKLRYVLKKELLADPALDIAGNRLPNAFIDRQSHEAAERQTIRDLAVDLGRDDAILIYPEGTRFSEEKLQRHRRRMKAELGQVEATTARLRMVLPPRPGGTLALLGATDADVVVLAHHGLEGLGTLREIWAGDPVGSRIAVRLWRVPRSEIPNSRSERVAWLTDLWTEVDEWVISAARARSSLD